MRPRVFRNLFMVVRPRREWHEPRGRPLAAQGLLGSMPQLSLDDNSRASYALIVCYPHFRYIGFRQLPPLDPATRIRRTLS